MSKSQKIESVVLFQIEQASKASKVYSQREFDKLGLGITIDQWVLLKIISESEDLTQKELASKSYRDPASITRTLDLLGNKGFITRESVPDNRRSYHIVLTNIGSQFIATHLPMILEHRKKSVEGLSKTELNSLSDMLQKIRENMT